MRLLNTAGQEPNIPFIKDLLVEFVTESSNLYGKSFVCYNNHSILHLPEDYLTHGQLNNINAFKFESFLGSHIKGAVRSGYKPLVQISKHISHQNKKIVENNREPIIKLMKKK